MLFKKAKILGFLDPVATARDSVLHGALKLTHYCRIRIFIMQLSV
jgi:hypothetical protein